MNRIHLSAEDRFLMQLMPKGKSGHGVFELHANEYIAKILAFLQESQGFSAKKVNEARNKNTYTLKSNDNREIYCCFTSSGKERVSFTVGKEIAEIIANDEPWYILFAFFENGDLVDFRFVNSDHVELTKQKRSGSGYYYYLNRARAEELTKMNIRDYLINEAVEINEQHGAE